MEWKLHLFLLVFPLCCCSSLEDRRWNVFHFAQEWPSSFCALSSNKCRKIPAIVSGWTIHGLWPELKDSKRNLKYCNRSWPFQLNKIKSLEMDLHRHWPDLHAREKWDILWKDEWKKHGTCATSVSATGNEFLYFKKALELNAQLNLTRALQNANILPSCKISYDACDIKKALKNQLKLTALPHLVFGRDGRTHQMLLREVAVCLKKDFTFDICSRSDARCITGKVYIYPEHQTKCP